MSITDWDLFGVHGVRQYLWAQLQAELDWDAADYGGLTPITTPEQQPEFTNFNKPFVVYSYAKKAGGNLYLLEQEIAAFTVYSQSATHITRVLNLFDAKLDKRDESAREINAFISASSLAQKYKDFDYKWTSTNGIQGPQPLTEEGGRRDGLITVNIAYTHYGTNGASIRF